MKKNISINISGVIFHIEEDGYDDLKKYLDSIHAYFSNYEDNQEIIEDIELRIAEVFHHKLSGKKQVITKHDVEMLIHTMGTIADFQAADSDEHVVIENDFADKETSEKTNEEDSSESHTQGKQLFRDQKHRVLGGVASGIAHYFGIDTIWVRLIFVVLLIISEPTAGFMFVAYILMWIVVPGSNDLIEDEKVKKLYRDNEIKVLGGVAGGISAYLRIDVSVIRLLFVALVFASGAGLIIYVVLWMITPMASSVTERMQMRGQPVTLSNIQDSIKKNLTTDEGEESALAKVLLFPFRLIAVLFETIAKLLGPFSKILTEIARVVVGATLVFIGFTGAVVLMASLTVSLGYVFNSDVSFFGKSIPFYIIPNTFDSWIYLLGFTVAIIPVLILLLLGISALLKRVVIPSSVAIVLFLIWILSGIGAALVTPMIIAQFSAEATRVEEVTYADESDVVTLSVNFVEEEWLDGDILTIRGAEDSVFKVRIEYFSKGSNHHDAIRNSEEISYQVQQKPGQIIFDSNYTFSRDAKFRNQTARVTLLVPEGRSFEMNRSIRKLVQGSFWRFEYDYKNIQRGNYWVFDGSRLECTNCDEGTGEKKYDSSKEEGIMNFGFEDFERLEIKGAYKVRLSKGDSYVVRVNGKDQMLDDVVAKQVHKTLELNDNSKGWAIFKSIPSDKWTRVYIQLPILKEVKVRGMSIVDFDGFEGDELRIETFGASSCTGSVEYDQLDLSLSGASRIRMTGEVDELQVRLNDAAVLSAYNLVADRARVKVSDIANAKVKCTDFLKVEASDAASVTYDGSPDIKNIDKSDVSSVQRRR